MLFYFSMLISFLELICTLQKIGIDELKVLHRVAYNRPGSGNEIKKNLRKFNGFPYTKDDKKYQGKLMTVERYSVFMPLLCEQDIHLWK